MGKETKGNDVELEIKDKKCIEVIKEINKLENELVGVIKEKTSKLKEQLLNADCTVSINEDTEEKSIFKTLSVSRGVMILGFASAEDQDKELIIPSEIKGKKVIGIAKDAFRNCQSIEQIYLSNGIELIGEYAFCGCANVKYITIPSSVTTVEKYGLYCNGNVQIYCGTKSKPTTWEDNWTYSTSYIKWGM